MSAAVEPIVTGDDLRRRLGVSLAALEAAKEAINAINVYPVPDGDTGTNMAATMREALDAVNALPGDATAGDVLQALSRGALYGARGNSGVILSQAIRGFSEGYVLPAAGDGERLALALERGSDRAYQAIAEPREGTMLTVLRAAGTGARDLDGFDSALDGAIKAAEDAQAATIDQLEELREAGVPDSGGEGICTILRGLRGVLPGPGAVAATVPAGYVHSRAHEEQFGYCLEFKLQAPEGTEIDLEALRAAMLEGGNRSLVVIGDPQFAHVHVHTDDTAATTERASQFGTLLREKVEDMAEQAEAFAQRQQGATPGTVLLALAYGGGFADLLESTGATVLRIEGTEKPAAGDIARAAEGCGAEHVVVLPNHRDAQLAASQAAQLAQVQVTVVGTKSQPQGIAASLAFAENAAASGNLEEMETAAAAVQTIETTIATEDRHVEGIDVRKGHAIALLDGKLVAATNDEVTALLEALAAGNAAKSELVTVYTGDEHVTADEDLRSMLRERFPGIEVDVLEGGQSLYGFVASIE